ncbi:hypothetical protein GOM49_08715 [Clostridium bovifaecis]|uniref:Uncharacterized protein n=1 Tax=Clostridium bovifaecis TaxID=2184719 RepID=A0A6I6FBL2_9CLOT|nr:hypothetical protein GOM49_08715 [Clostridium bovifaecis]
MNINRASYKFILLLLKCYLIILAFGIMLPKIIDFILLKFIINFNEYKNSTLVFNALSKYEILLYRYRYII